MISKARQAYLDKMSERMWIRYLDTGTLAYLPRYRAEWLIAYSVAVPHLSVVPPSQCRIIGGEDERGETDSLV